MFNKLKTGFSKIITKIKSGVLRGFDTTRTFITSLSLRAKLIAGVCTLLVVASIGGAVYYANTRSNTETASKVTYEDKSSTKKSDTKKSDTKASDIVTNDTTKAAAEDTAKEATEATTEVAQEATRDDTNSASNKSSSASSSSTAAASTNSSAESSESNTGSSATNTSNASQSYCDHNWEPVYVTYHHDAVTHNEVEMAWNNYVYYNCHCGLYKGIANYDYYYSTIYPEMQAHIDNNDVNCIGYGGSEYIGQAAVGVHEVVDQEAYDQVIHTGDKCTKCGTWRE